MNKFHNYRKINRYFEEEKWKDFFFYEMSGGCVCVNEKHYLTKESPYPHFHLYRKLINT